MRWITIFAKLLMLMLLPHGHALAQSGRVVAYEVKDNREIPAALTGRTGDADAGRTLYFDRNLTGCSGCHGSPGGPGAQADDSAEQAPSLAGVANRMAPGRIRLWLVAPQIIDPATAMPAYYGVGQRTNPDDPRFGEPLLSATEIEDLVAYLSLQRTEQ